MEQRTGSKIGKEYIIKAVYCHPAYLTNMQGKSYKMLGWMNQEGIRIAGRNISNLRHADDTTVMAESKEDLKSLLRVKEESKKAGLKLSIQKIKIMTSSHIRANRLGKSGNSDRFHFLGLQNQSKTKRCLLLGRKAMTNLDSVLKTKTSLCHQRRV